VSLAPSRFHRSARPDRPPLAGDEPYVGAGAKPWGALLRSIAHFYLVQAIAQPNRASFQPTLPGARKIGLVLGARNCRKTQVLHGGAERDRTADLVNAIRILGYLQGLARIVGPAKKLNNSSHY
jgi:hypothetical protein